MGSTVAPRNLLWLTVVAAGLLTGSGVGGLIFSSRLLQLAALDFALIALSAFLWEELSASSGDSKAAPTDGRLTLILASSVILGLAGWTGWQLLSRPFGENSVPIFYAAVALATGFGSLLAARILFPGSTKSGTTPLLSFLALTARQIELISFAIAAALFVGIRFPAIPDLVAIPLLIWVIAQSTEMFLRSLYSFFSKAHRESAHSLVDSPLRAFLLQSGILLRLKILTKEKLADDPRATWVLRQIWEFFPVLALIFTALVWLSTSIIVIPLDEVGIVRRFGRLNVAPIQPGLHLGLPWPFDQVKSLSPKRLTTMTIGVEARSEDVTREALLWARRHSGTEFNLVLGEGTELVAVNAILYYQISPSKSGIIDHIKGWQNPSEVLSAVAYRALMKRTCSMNINQILTLDRASFAKGIEEDLRSAAQRMRIGLEVTSFEILSLHPPIESAEKFLEVISARLDARRFVVEANGDAAIELENARIKSGGLESTASVEALRRIGTARAETERMRALVDSARLHPDIFKTRLSLQAKEDALVNKKLYLLDKTVQSSGGEMWLDFRSNSQDNPPGGKR